MTEVKQAGAAAPGELKTALLGFVEELKGFRQDIQTKIEAQDNRMTMFERKTAHRNRVPLSTESQPEAPYRKAFDAYLRHGDDKGLRGPAIEAKGLSSSDAGFIAGPQVADQVSAGLGAYNSLRAVANVVEIEASSYEVLVDRAEMDSAWADEQSVAALSSPRTEKVAIKLHELSAMPKATQRLLDDAAFDVEGWLAARIVDRFSRAEARAFLHGDGSDQPEGLLSLTGVDKTDAEFGELGSIKTGVDGGFGSDPAGKLVDLVYALPAQHRVNAHFLMNSKTAALIRKLRDNDGRFLWTDSLAAGEPARLLGYPVLVLEDMPDVSEGDALLFGDFKAAYTIVERPELRILRDPFSAKPHVLFYATKRVGGGIVDARAMRLLQFRA